MRGGRRGQLTDTELPSDGVLDGALAFIDLEASGLGAASWPVEVGWGGVTGAPTAILIRPDASWNNAAWDPEAEKLHGLSRDRLAREGAAISVVCEALNAALSGRAVYSDAPDWDSFWLYRLFATARIRQGFKILAFADLVTPMMGAHAEALVGEAEARAPRRHRAAADVAFLQTLYGLAAAQ